MNHAEINELLSKVSITVSAIEEELLIPAGVLSKAKNGKRDLPAKYEQRLRDFVSGDLDVSSGVVFSGRVIDSECMELLRSDEGIETPGDAVSFLCKFWVAKMFKSMGTLQKIYEYGGFVEIHTLPSSQAGFPFGFPSAVYFLKRGYKGETKIKMLDGISFKARK